MTERPAFVLLEDGTWYRGTTRHTGDPAFGEVVFTTSLTGYQETFTDPSYLGQILVMTAPMIGNYGINDADMESGRPQVAGVVVREMARSFSSWRASGGLDNWLLKTANDKLSPQLQRMKRAVKKATAASRSGTHITGVI